MDPAVLAAQPQASNTPMDEIVTLRLLPILDRLFDGKARILGENLSLLHQLLYTNNLWKADGYARKPPVSTLRQR